MAKKTNRKSISVSGLLYARLREYSKENEQSMSGLVERLINKRLDEWLRPNV